MPSSALLQVVSLLRFLGRQAAEKLAHLLHSIRQNQASAGLAAVAAFAISIFFAWRLARLHPNTRPRRPKPREPHPSPSSAASASALDSQSRAGGQASASPLGLEAKDRAGTSGSTEPPKTPSLNPLATAVRKQLAGAQRVTCHILGVLLLQDTPAKLQQGGASLIQAAAQVILEICRQADVYLMAQVDDDASEVAVLSALEAGGILGPASPFNSTKLLFCSTDTGIMSFVRQLEPDLHIESSAATVEQLKRFVRKELLVTSMGSSTPAPSGANIVTAHSLKDYFHPA